MSELVSGKSDLEGARLGFEHHRPCTQKSLLSDAAAEAETQWCPRPDTRHCRYEDTFPRATYKILGLLQMPALALFLLSFFLQHQQMEGSMVFVQ